MLGGCPHFQRAEGQGRKESQQRVLAGALGLIVPENEVLRVHLQPVQLYSLLGFYSMCLDCGRLSKALSSWLRLCPWKTCMLKSWLPVPQNVGTFTIGLKVGHYTLWLVYLKRFGQRCYRHVERLERILFHGSQEEPTLPTHRTESQPLEMWDNMFPLFMPLSL